MRSAVWSLVLSVVVLAALRGVVPAVVGAGAAVVGAGAAALGAEAASADTAPGAAALRVGPVRAGAAARGVSPALGGSGTGAGRSPGAPAGSTEPGATERPARAPGPLGGDARRRWVWPTASRVVVRPWEAPETEYGPGHRGLDVAAPPGTSVVAVAAGTVSFAGSVGGRPVVAVDHGDGLVSTLDAVVPGVTAGDHVEQGDLVGTTAPGHCAEQEPCLHIGARLYGRYVDPAAFLPRAAWPVLLPDGS